MKARAVPAGEKLIQDYLSRVAEAALRLPKGSRMTFVNRTRALIEREAGQAGLSDPERVMEVLSALGEPEELVRKERARIDAAWLKRRSAGREGGQVGQAADAAPGEYRRITARRKPATYAQPLPGQRQPQPGERPARRRPGAGWIGRLASGAAPRSGQAGTRSGQAGPRAGAAEQPPPAQPSAGGAPAEQAATPPPGLQAPAGPSSGPAVPVAPAPRSAPTPTPPGSAPTLTPPGSAPTPTPPPGSEPPDSGVAPEPSAPRGPSSGPPPGEPGSGPVTLAGLVFDAESEPASGTPATPLSADWAGVFARRTSELARRHPLETIAIVLLGLGGLIFPILPPVWVLGSVLALASRLWDRRDKWVALIGPLVFAALATVVTTALLGGHGNLVQNYSHAFRLDIGYVLRLGCVASAVYLAWRVHRGPRVKVPPWKR